MSNRGGLGIAQQVSATHKVLGERRSEGIPLVLPRDLLRYPAWGCISVLG